MGLLFPGLFFDSTNLEHLFFFPRTAAIASTGLSSAPISAQAFPMRRSIPGPDDGDPSRKRSLPKLDRANYQGLAIVHWVLSIQDRRTGWLNEAFFLRFQLVGLHACLRYRIASPCVCLMPDHIHLLLMGYDEVRSDQTLAVSFLRKHLGPYLEAAGGFAFQSQAYDHVLREAERQRGSFESHAAYIRQNPVRAGLVAEEGDDPWPYECALVPGYPDLNIRDADFWDRFWRIYYEKLLVRE